MQIRRFSRFCSFPLSTMQVLHVVCLLVALGLSAAILPKSVDYSGHKVVSVLPKSEKGLRTLENFERQGTIKYWIHPAGLNRPASFQISASDFELVSNVLAEQALSPIVLIDNIQELIEKQNKEILERQLENANSKAFDFENFHTYSELLAFMQETAANNPLVSYSVIGQSYEGRDIGQATVRTGSAGVKQIIFLECGIHAREWITESTCIWIFDQLANGYGVDAEITALVDKFDWIIVPTSNPDGYEYSWASDRLWRKNRALTDNALCPGVDLNRNYDANFGGDGSSPLPCSETYHGVSAFSESEAAAIRDSLAANRGFVKAFVSIHSYGGIWMSPYGYIRELPLEYDEMYRVMAIGAEAITATYGTPFEYANEAAILYLTSGTTRDYAYVGGDNIIYAYTIETRGKAYGFVPPPSEILETAIETWNGIKAMANNLL
ncbi:carboxypeptidase B [Daphnia magna]|uniref:carboxypeptidase B n=1 Tax=Daphnia magna TaxID=35525 RepID=UPI001E1BCC7E|nr:carboxypeptidase B [Daphnia magna]